MATIGLAFHDRTGDFRTGAGEGGTVAAAVDAACDVLGRWTLDGVVGVTVLKATVDGVSLMPDGLPGETRVLPDLDDAGMVAGIVSRDGTAPGLEVEVAALVARARVRGMRETRAFLDAFPGTRQVPWDEVMVHSFHGDGAGRA